MTAAVLAVAAGLLAAAASHVREREQALARAGAIAGGPGRMRSRQRRDLGGSSVLRVAAVVVGVGLGSVVAGTPGAVAGTVAAISAPAVVRRRAEARHAERVESQLAEAVATVAAAMRAGHSLIQALSLAADEAEEPLGPSLREVVARTELGVPLSESLDRWGAALPGRDVRLVAGVLGMHQRTGGDLPAVLDGVAGTLRERRAAAREVRSLTAQARLSGAILGFLPIGFFLFLSATSRQDIEAAYRSPLGATAIVAGLAMQGLAFLWIRSLLRVEG